MRFIVSAVVAFLILLGGVVAVIQYISSDPSTELLDLDNAAVTSQIAEVEAARSEYGAGAIQNIILARLEILKTTLAMLNQKRSSIVRRIDLNYTVEGARHIPDEDILASLNAERKAAETERNRFRAEAAQYSGGLIQAMALMNAATSEMTVAQLDLAILSERYGFLIDFSGSAEAGPAVSRNTVEDAEAL